MYGGIPRSVWNLWITRKSIFLNDGRRSRIAWKPIPEAIEAGGPSTPESLTRSPFDDHDALAISLSPGTQLIEKEAGAHRARPKTISPVDTRAAEKTRVTLLITIRHFVS